MVDFQGWSKMTLKIKMAYFSSFRRGFHKKFFGSHLQNYIGKLKMKGGTDLTRNVKMN